MSAVAVQSVFDLTRLLCIGLKAGDRLNDQICPKCDGGNTREKSLRIQVSGDGVAHVRCFRSKCGHSARIRLSDGTAVVSAVSDDRVTATARRYEGEPIPLTDAQIGYFKLGFGLTKEEVTSWGFSWDNAAKRVIMPVYGPKRELRGHIARSYNKDNWPKVLSYREPLVVPFAGWYLRPDGYPVGTPVVLVEDQVSALKVSRTHPACALCGCSVTLDHAIEALRVANKGTIFIALDRDATDRAVMYQKKYGIFGNFKTVLLSKDCKYMNEEELREHFQQ